MHKPELALNPFCTGLLMVALSTFAGGQQNTKPADASTTKSDTSTHSSLTAKDRQFVQEAADGGLAEVELGQLATQKANDPQVKAFGQRMVDDHGKANDQLKKLASDKGVNVPASPSAKHKATKDKLSKLSSDEFDKAYMAEMLKDHKKDVSDFRKESTTASDPDVKKFASETLPTLEDHLKQAQSISPAAGAKTSASQ